MSAMIGLVIAALIRVESHGNAHAVGRAGELGCLQIKAVVVEDVNRFAGTKFSYTDCDDPMKSRKIAELYLGHYCNRDRLKREVDPLDVALVWHFGPRGYLRADEPEAKRYWAKVREAMAANGRRGTSRVTPETWMHHD